MPQGLMTKDIYIRRLEFIRDKNRVYIINVFDKTKLKIDLYFIEADNYNIAIEKYNKFIEDNTSKIDVYRFLYKKYDESIENMEYDNLFQEYFNSNFLINIY